MTLNTRIYIQDKIGHAEVFAFCQELVAEFDEAKRTASEQVSNDEEWGSYRVLMNQVGQGLPAWLMLYYRPTGMLNSPEESSEHSENCNLPSSRYYDADEPDCGGTNSYTHDPAHWLKVSFDTSYGYNNREKGWGCSDLHSYYITRLGAWLDERKIPWSWQNEFTGKIHTGYDGLKEFGQNGMDAAQWFTGTVLPAIASGALLETIKEGDRD